MLESILAQSRESYMSLTGIIMLALYVFIFVLVIICLIRVARYFGNAGKEQKLMRMEMGKLAEEVHLLRQEIKGGTANKST